MFKAFLTFLLNIFWVVIPIALILHFHVPLKTRLSIIPFIVVGFIFYLKSRSKHRIYNSRRTKEEEVEGGRTTKVELYFMRRFAYVFVSIIVFTFLVRFNFKEISITLILIGVSLLFGSLVKLRRIQEFGV